MCLFLPHDAVDYCQLSPYLWPLTHLQMLARWSVRGQSPTGAQTTLVVVVQLHACMKMSSHSGGSASFNCIHSCKSSSATTSGFNRNAAEQKKTVSDCGNEANCSPCLTWGHRVAKHINIMEKIIVGFSFMLVFSSGLHFIYVKLCIVLLMQW